jgi:hypothetical protein
MKTLLTTLLSFIVLSASATVYNSDGTVQNIQAIHNNQAVVVSEANRRSNSIFVPIFPRVPCRILA